MRHNEYAHDFTSFRDQSDIQRLEIENWLTGKMGELATAFHGAPIEELPAADITACRRALIKELVIASADSQSQQGAQQ